MTMCYSGNRLCYYVRAATPDRCTGTSPSQLLTGIYESSGNIERPRLKQTSKARNPLLATSKQFEYLSHHIVNAFGLCSDHRAWRQLSYERSDGEELPKEHVNNSGR